jgi:predicted RNase H-like HicB family nuclease
MSINLKSKTALVWDNGVFCDLAVHLGKSFGRLLYYVPWTSSMPKSNALLVGHGLEDIERIVEPWSYFDEIDIWIFPDVYESGLQEWLVKQGKRVWGCRGGAELEIDRPISKETCRKLGIDIGPYKVITGLDNLRSYLKKNKDQWVKISGTRGDMETFGAPNYERVEPRLDELEHNMGALKKIMEFTVEEGINDAIESGYDGYTIDGKFPKGALVGVEVKDEAYLGKTVRWQDLPESVRGVNEKLAPALKGYGYRGFISTEVRCTEDGKAYLIDPCCRAGSPPNEVYQLIMANLAEVVWYGAEGIVIEPEYNAKWGAEVLLISEWADQNWMQISFPEKIRDNVKLRNLCRIEDEYYVIPQWTGCAEIGAIVALGDTPQQAIDEVKRIAELVHGHLLDKPIDALDKAGEQMEELLGPDKPLTKDQRKAEELFKAGKISDRQLDKVMAKG